MFNAKSRPRFFSLELSALFFLFLLFSLMSMCTRGGTMERSTQAKPRGIRNLHNLCYAISTLQMLFSMGDAFFKELETLCSGPRSCRSNSCLPCSLKLSINALKEARSSPVVLPINLQQEYVQTLSFSSLLPV